MHALNMVIKMYEKIRMISFALNGPRMLALKTSKHGLNSRTRSGHRCDIQHS